MKLYTEEQVTELTTAAFTAGQNHNPAIFGVTFEKITPIELPSDEEIEQIASDYKSTSEFSDIENFEDGAVFAIKWMRNQNTRR